MNTGSFFTIGTTHLVCEDYALHGPNYVILSDGCSNGGGPRLHTDWGSRILCKAAEQHVHCLPGFDTFMNRTISTAKTQVSAYPNLDPRCLTATLLTAYESAGSIWLFMVGDGVMGCKTKEGQWHIREISYPQNAPYYMKYELDPNDKATYIKNFGSKFTHRAWVMGTGFEELDFAETELDINETPYVATDYPIEGCEFIFIISDGASSFYKPSQTKTSKQNEKVGLMEVLPVLLDFRNFDHNFVERQCGWVFKTNRIGSFGKLGWHNADDVSLGIIHCGQTVGLAPKTVDSTVGEG